MNREETMHDSPLSEKECFDCNEAALRLLTRRAHSRLELQRKLQKRGVQDAVVKKVLDDLERAGLVNDLEFGKAYCEYRRNGSRPVGRMKIVQELKKRGLENPVIEQALLETDDCADEDGEFQRALEASQRKWAEISRRTAEPFAAKGKLYRFLAGRGFSADVCRRVMEHLVD